MTALQTLTKPADQPGSVHEIEVFFTSGKPVGLSLGATTHATE